MNQQQQQQKSTNESSDYDNCQSSCSSLNTDMIKKDIPQRNVSLLSKRVFHISNLLPSANNYEEEREIANCINQRLPIGPCRISRKAVTLIQRTISNDIPLFDETSITLTQLRRSKTPHPHKYKASANLKQQSGAQPHTSTLAMCGYNEDTEETPINLDHLRRQQSGGIKKTAQSISQINLLNDYTDLDETAILIGQIYRLDPPQIIQYKSPLHIQPSISYTKKTSSVLSQEEPAEETSANIYQLRQPTLKKISTTNGGDRECHCRLI
ncbi:unnamed protein product [Adineta steineri]|uniref:Uncharacterized protein n=1 Tax=Adineta steineri TaxID=433720 RepID=A0A813SJN2_9BILA|nr:unnamed protein product [Adineta steineri]CAF4053403.1 unnamed protein product [Adineta steineri]